MRWFFAVDNKSRKPEDANIPADPVFKELREKLANIIEKDERKVPNLKGELVRYLSQWPRPPINQERKRERGKKREREEV